MFAGGVVLAAQAGWISDSNNNKLFGSMVTDTVGAVAFGVFAGLAASGVLPVSAGGCYALFLLTGVELVVPGFLLGIVLLNCVKREDAE